MALQQSSQDLSCKGRQAEKPVEEEGLLCFAQAVQEERKQEGPSQIYAEAETRSAAFLVG